MAEKKVDVCDICKVGILTLRSVPEQGISCARCGIAICDICYDLSVKLYGFVGDKNLVLVKPLVIPESCMNWPYNEYYPEDYGVFLTTRGCIKCMTESPPKRDKFGHFIKGDDYPQGESFMTRVINERKAGNIKGYIPP